jgi:hypothetical protein
MYSKVYPTVDIAVFRDDKKYLLLGEKGKEKHGNCQGALWM